MRVGSTGPFHSIPQGTPQPCTRFLKVHLLVGGPLYFLVEPKSRTKDLYSELCSYMKSQGMQDTALFGLSVLLDGEYIFVEPDYKLSKYAPKSWRSSSTNGLDSNGKPLLELYFQVQFYVESPLLLQDEVSLEHYYCQLQNNVLERGMLHPSSSQQALFILAGLALQAELGETHDNQCYSKPHNYLPQQLVESCGESRLTQTLASLHRANSGLSKSLARQQYIREASSLETSPIPHNSHVYRLRTSKQEPQPGSVLLAICTRGVEIYQESSQKPINGKFLWNDIGKLCFDRKKFEIRGVNSAFGEKFCYYTSSDEKSKHLLALCKVTHQYSMAMQPKLAQIRGREESERKQYREWPVEIGKYTTRYGGTGEQRISVISSTSSTTTSGIVSDRVHSLDESEDDLELEIMINSPPAPSVESLALAHLCESAQTTPSPQPNYDLKQGADCVDGHKISPVAMTPATTDGSQCSSSASTIVVQQQQHSPETISNNTMVIRCESVTSSLELGYSHTAQHSGLSGSAELDYSVQSNHCTTSSGVFTLDEASDNHTVLETVASSSGIGLESHGQRSRSGSLVSNNGSFHGDGSDPSDAGRGNLLTAEELSNLIVHRSPKPRRGVYPSRATVSSTLDSCSDYVTLPPPPLPPPRQNLNEKNYVVLEQPKQHSPNIYYSQNMLPPVMVPPHYQYISDIVHPLNSLPSPTTEESNTRYITSKQINVLAAHSGYMNSNPNFSNARYDPSSRMKLNSNMIPIVGSNNYLDVRQSYLQQYHPSPPHLVNRQPPPPPPRPNLATVYTSQVTRSQIEQFKQQLYSDVDYVMYPIKDPAVSKQEYLDSKIALGYRQTPPPPYPSGKNIMYRSTPNVAVASGYLPVYNKQLAHNKFASNQNLSDYYAPSFLSSSPLYSAAASYSSSSTHSLRFDPLHQPIPPMTMPTSFHRTLSDDNILNFERPVLERVKYRRPPPPIPTDSITSSPLEGTAGLTSPVRKSPPRRDPPPETPLDISSLREKSKNLDLPLISALCNDRSLLKQTNAFVMPRHPEKSRPQSWHVDSSTSTADLTGKKSIFSTLLSKSISNPTSPSSKNSKLKYPVSGLSTNQIVKANRKTVSRHKHPEVKVDQVKVTRSQSTGGSSSKDIRQ
ncbi:protein expanded [Halyomorpha halys]|uniref:protein expanded n=1 Tax=Halyomorpha halys TaxID=286706 RepID=UPI0006D51D01|nr:protein expanded [Halyomorpha halys]